MITQEITLNKIDYFIKYDVETRTYDANTGSDETVECEKVTNVDIYEASYLDRNGLDCFVLDDDIADLEVALRDYINESGKFNELT